MDKLFINYEMNWICNNMKFINQILLRYSCGSIDGYRVIAPQLGQYVWSGSIRHDLQYLHFKIYILLLSSDVLDSHSSSDSLSTPIVLRIASFSFSVYGAGKSFEILSEMRCLSFYFSVISKGGIANWSLSIQY